MAATPSQAAHASNLATGTASQARATAIATGGMGGGGYGKGYTGGRGGGATITTSNLAAPTVGVTAHGYTAYASATATGGQGGYGGGDKYSGSANGGDGANVALTNEVSATATGGSAQLFQYANGGFGGSSSGFGGGTAGTAGIGSSSLTFTPYYAATTALTGHVSGVGGRRRLGWRGRRQWDRRWEFLRVYHLGG